MIMIKRLFKNFENFDFRIILPLIIILSFAYGINEQIDYKNSIQIEKPVVNKVINKYKNEPLKESELSNNIRVREVYGRIEILYRDINYTFGDNNFPASGVKVNSIIKDEWTQTQAFLENNEETKAYIWEIQKSPFSNTFYFSVLHDKKTKHWNALYQLKLENKDYSKAVLTTLVDTNYFDNPYVPFIAQISPTEKTIEFTFSCVECEPGLYPDHYIMSVEGQNKFGYKNIGPVKDLTWNDDESFSYKRIPQECIDMVVSYETMEDSRKCVENTPVEIVVDSL